MNDAGSTKKKPFDIDNEEELNLRINANLLVPSALIAPATSFDEYVRQLMIPVTVMELHRKVCHIQFSAWEVEAIRLSLQSGLLAEILALKYAQDPSHPPYVRVACTGKGDFDYLAKKWGHELIELDEHLGDFGSPAILEIWPAGHYSPIHSHGSTTGIIYCLTGQIDVMVYDSLAWDAKKMALMTLSPGQCAWLNEKYFPVHRVYCPMLEGTYAATFHVYLNQSEIERASPEEGTRDVFDFVDEDEPHEPKKFATYSDLSWRVLRKELAKLAAKRGL